MRILAIDAGNSRIKWGLAEDGAWLRQSWAPTQEADSLGAIWGRLPLPQAVIAANVAGEQVERALAAAARRLHRRIRFARAAANQCGVRSSYDNPQQLGADRWAALIGAWHLYRGSCVVVGAGTTMTVDALTTDGVFLGGMIVAGMDLMREALANGTAGLKVEAGKFAFFPACTADAIESGAVNALAGAVERMQRYLNEAGQAAPLVVLSGGAAPQLAPQLNGSVEVVDNLVLEGLARIVLEAK